MRLEPVELQEGAEEAARRQAQAAHEVRAEYDPLTLLRRRPYFPRRRGAGSHQVRAGELAHLAEVLDGVVIHYGSVPHAGTHGRSRGGGGGAHRCGCGAAWCGGGKKKRRQEEAGEQGGTGACFAVPLPPPTYKPVG